MAGSRSEGRSVTHRKQQPEPETTGQKPSEHAAPRGGVKPDKKLAAEHDRRLYESGRWAAGWLARGRFSREASGAFFSLFLARCDGDFSSAVRMYQERSLLQPATPAYERAMALDIWCFVSMRWIAFAPARKFPVWFMLFLYMIACRAPLPAEYASARRAAKRIVRRVRVALDPSSGMSPGWRRYCFGRYPLTAQAVRAAAAPSRRRSKSALRN
jgi:hypothetical protein